jgi:hypothetical protein
MCFSFNYGPPLLAEKEVRKRHFFDSNQSKVLYKKPSFGPSKWPQKLKPAKNSKLPKLPENYFELVGKGGWPYISTCINPPSLGSNGLHFFEFPGEREKRLLDLHLCEMLVLLETSRCSVCGSMSRTC